METMCFLFFIVTASFVLGYAAGVSYYTSKVRAAFGITDPQVSVIGWLNTKAIKRQVDEARNARE